MTSEQPHMNERCPINKSAFVNVYLRLIIFINFFSTIRYWQLHSLNFGLKQVPVCRTLSIFRNYSGMLIGRPIAILYFLARKVTDEGAEERESI